MSSILSIIVDNVNHMKNIEAIDVLEAVHTVMHTLRARQYAAQEGVPHGLTHLEGKVLGFFAKNPAATQAELSAHSGRDKGQIARLIAGLRARGLLEPDCSDGDRRVVRLKLTTEGKSAQQALMRQRQQIAESACAELDPAERCQLVRLLEKLNRQLAS